MTTTSIFQALLYTHIAGGSLALVSGYGALLVKRGGPRHRQLGRLYVYGMLAVILTGFPMSILHPNPFLFGIVIFTAYQLFSGRSAALNRIGEPTTADRIAPIAMTVTSLLALGAAAWAFLTKLDIPSFQLIAGSVFAVIGLGLALADFRQLKRGPVKGTERIIKHLGNMCGALIATTTAVAVTMINYIPAAPQIIAWLAPTLIISPVIAYWTKQLRNGRYNFG